MKVLDLCSGLGGASQAFRDRGHDVTTLDIDSRFKPDLCMDVRKYHGRKGSFDVVLAAPPCTVFSVASIWKYWKHIGDKRVNHGLELVRSCFRIIKEIEPKFFVLENPMGMLRKLIGMPTETIFMCSYGLPFKKPTDLWHNLPKLLKKPCAPHEKTPHESHKGIDGMSDISLKSKWPYALSLRICEIFEEEEKAQTIDEVPQLWL